MIIGIPKEIRGDETRASILPSGVESLVTNGHQVIIEKNAGLASGNTDEDYISAGAKVMPTMKDIYENAEFMFKTKELTEEEFDYVREGQIFTGYYQTQIRPELTEFLIEKKIIVYSYERVRDERGEFPLLAPMSDISGRVAVILGVYHMFNTVGGDGTLIGGFPGVFPAKVTIFGAGNSGLGALRYAAGLGAEVTLFDRNLHKLKKVNETFPGVRTLLVNESNIRAAISETNLLINSIKYKADGHLITRKMLKLMKPNAVIVDADGMPDGAIETSRETSHADPSYVVDGIKHISIPNYPNAVTKTATTALANATTPYILDIANKGWIKATRENIGLKNGLTVAQGLLTLEDVATTHGIDYTPVDKALDMLEG